MLQRTSWREWVLCLGLYVPVLLFYAAHFAAGGISDNVIPTGFVQYDQPYYMANARQYLDGATNGVLYASPFSALADPHAIYFQPQIALLGVLLSILRCDPGTLFVAFGLVFGLLCIRTCLRVLDHILPNAGRWRTLIAVLFLWGGGIFFLLGFGHGLLHGMSAADAWASAFRFDPANGWWFLNLGRNLVYPLESYYHFLFFSVVLALLRKRFILAWSLATLLVMSHPFTGVATLVMLIVWFSVERFIARSAGASIGFLLGTVVTLALALVYYGIFLPRDPEHASLVAQWRLPWKEEGITIIGAYALVGTLALIGLRSMICIPASSGSSTQRLLIVQAIVWLVLENHDLFITPMQPLHFTRGYSWSALFLLGAPVLLSALKKMHERPRSLVLRTSLVVGSMTMLCDNATWMYARTNDNLYAHGESVCLTRDQRELFTWLSREVPHNSLLVVKDPMTAYLALVYTPHRAYSSHKFNTPFAEQRSAALVNYFQGRFDDPLLEQPLLAIVDERNAPFVFATRSKELHRNGSYAVYQVPQLPRP